MKDTIYLLFILTCIVSLSSCSLFRKAQPIDSCEMQLAICRFALITKENKLKECNDEFIDSNYYLMSSK